MHNKSLQLIYINFVKILKLCNIARAMALMICLLSLMLLSCTSLSRFNRIDVGMTKADVLARVGSPVQSQYKDLVEYWIYGFYRNGRWIRKEIQFKDHQVIYVGDFMDSIERERYEYRSPIENMQNLKGHLHRPTPQPKKK